MTSTTALFASPAAVGLPRVLGMHSEAYQAIAHVFVGGLAGAYLFGRDKRYLLLLLALSALEVGCFLFYGKQS